MSLSIEAVSNFGQLFDNSSTQKVTEQENSFANILSDSINETKQAEAVDDASSVDLMSGTEDSLQSAMIDAQKAELTLQLTVQIRNKILDSYNEIMNMQV